MMWILFFFFSQVLEEWTTHTSYDMGLETERAALEKLATHDVHQEQVTSETVSPGSFKKVSKRSTGNILSKCLIELKCWKSLRLQTVFLIIYFLF